MQSRLPLLPSGPGGVRKSTVHGPWQEECGAQRRGHQVELRMWTNPSGAAQDRVGGCPPGKIPVPVYQANNDRVFVRCYPYHFSYPSGGRGVPCTFTLSQAAGKFVIVAGTTAREEMLWARTSTAAHRPKRFNKPHARWAVAPPAGSSAAAANRGTEPTPSATAQKTRDRVRITFVLATFKALQQLMAEWFVIACGGGRTGRGSWPEGSRICLCRRR